LTFFVVVTPIGLAARPFGRDRLGRRQSQGAPSYWKPLEPEGETARHFRQY
jgi:hypothetical protein